MLLTSRTSRRWLRGMLPVALGLLLGVEPARAQERLTRLTLEEAVGLATRANPTVRAKQFEHQAVGDNGHGKFLDLFRGNKGQAIE